MMYRSIRLLDLINGAKLDNFLKSFTRVTGVAAIIADASGHPITRAHNFSNLCQYYCRCSEAGRQKCWESDRFGGLNSMKLKNKFVYRCLNAGLMDSAYPIVVDGYHLATALCGQVLFEPIEAETAAERAVSIKVEDIDGYLNALEQIPIMSSHSFDEIVDHMQIVVQTISELALHKYLSNQRTRHYLNKLINSVCDGIVSTNGDAIISIVNEGCARMFGCEKKKLIGQSLYSLFSDAASVKTCQEKIESNRHRNGRTVLMAVNAQKESFPVQISISRFRSDDLKNSGYVAVLRDISEEKKIEQMKEDLIGMLTHDMGNPVLSIQKAIQLMVDGTLGQLNPKQAEIMSLALGTSHQLYGIVSDFLDIYRSENGKFLLRKMQTDYTKIIEEGAKNLQIFAMEKQISISTDLPESPIILSADRNRLIRTLNNLLDNAIRFSPKGKRIEIASSVLSRENRDLPKWCPEINQSFQLDHDRDYVLTAVTDQGPGIPEEHQKNIFEKFYTFRSKKSSGRKALGLGLAFCKLVIESHEGAIWLTSPLNFQKNARFPGSRFVLILPLDEDQRRNSRNSERRNPL